MKKFSCACCGAVKSVEEAKEVAFEYEGRESSGTCCSACAEEKSSS